MKSVNSFLLSPFLCVCVSFIFFRFLSSLSLETLLNKKSTGFFGISKVRVTVLVMCVCCCDVLYFFVYIIYFTVICCLYNFFIVFFFAMYCFVLHRFTSNDSAWNVTKFKVFSRLFFLCVLFLFEYYFSWENLFTAPHIHKLNWILLMQNK